MGLLFKQNTRQQSNLHTQGSLGVQTGCLGGPERGTETEQLSVVEIYWNSSRIVIGLI